MKHLIRIWLLSVIALLAMTGSGWGATQDFKGTLNGYSFARPGPLAAPTELTIASDAITVTQTLHTVDTQADAASDDLVTINGGAAGQIIYLRAAHTDRTVVIKETGNISIPMGSQISLDTTAFWVQLNYDADLSKWVVVGALPDTLSLTALDMTSATSSIPQPLAATASIPGTCTQGSKWQDSTTGIDYSCTATNTWTAMGDRAGTGQVERIGASFDGGGAAIAVNKIAYVHIPYAITTINQWTVVCDVDSGTTGIIITPYMDAYAADTLPTTTMCTTGTAPHTTDGAGAGGSVHQATWDCNVTAIPADRIVAFKVTTAPTSATWCSVNLKVTR